MKGPKHGGKTPRKSILSDFGLIPIPGDKQRRYVQISSGEIMSRRQAEKRAVGNFEKFAKRNAEKRGPKAGPMAKYNRTVRAYAEANGISVGDARSDAGFRKTYRDLKNESKSKGPTMRRLSALHDLDLIDDDTYEQYMATYMGEE